MAGCELTGQADGGLLLVLQHVEQRVCETGLFFGLQLSVSCRAMSCNNGAYMFEVKLGLLADGGIGVERVLDTLPQRCDVHGGRRCAVWRCGPIGHLEGLT